MNKEIQYMLIQTFHPAYNSLYCDIFQQIHDSNQPYIPIVVDSPGGYTWNLSVLLDLIEDSDKPIITISSGISMSCGAVLATSGTSGLRIIGQNTNFMIHQAASMAWGKSSDMMNDSADVHRTTTQMVYKQFDRKSGHEDGYTENLIKENMNADLFLSAEDTLKHGFMDLIMSRGKALRSIDDIYNDYLEKHKEDTDVSFKTSYR